MARERKSIITQGTVALNRRAGHDYTLGEKLEAGLTLMGSEVKSLRLGRANITEGYVKAKNGELFLLNAYIADYQSKGAFAHKERQPRKILVHTKELKKIIGALTRERATVVPLSLYFNKRGIAKILLGIATGKKQHEKRQAIKERDWKRQQARLIRDKK